MPDLVLYEGIHDSETGCGLEPHLDRLRINGANLVYGGKATKEGGMKTKWRKLALSAAMGALGLEASGSHEVVADVPAKVVRAVRPA